MRSGPRRPSYHHCVICFFFTAVVYNWEKDSQDIFISTNPYIFISSNGRLYFSEVTQADEGNYNCRVSLSGISKTIVGTSQPPSAISKPIQLVVKSQGNSIFRNKSNLY